MENKPSRLLKFFAFIGVIACIAGIAYALYKYFTPDYLEDTDDDDDFDDDFQDFFEDEDAGTFKNAADDIKEAAAEAAEKAEDIVEEAADKAEEAAEEILS